MTMKKMLGYDFDDLFEMLGLQRRRSIFQVVLPAVGLFAFGAGLGAATGLMLAPSSGRRLRKDFGDRIDQVRERMKRDLNATTTSSPSSPS